MTAPQIPNLLDTLRFSKASNTRSARTPRQTHDRTPQDTDRIVQGTDSDAAGSRLSAVSIGYLDDIFAAALGPSPTPLQSQAQAQHASGSAAPRLNARRMPIINRGTYVRTTALDTLVAQFLDAHSGRRVQIVSLGAGSDTRFFRMVHADPGLAARLVYHEVDFAATAAAKVNAIERSSLMLDLLKGAAAAATSAAGPGTPKAEGGDGGRVLLDIAEDRTALRSAAYSIHPLDLRSLVGASPPAGSGTSTSAASQVARPLDVSPTLPTLVISECCLTYLQPETSLAILSYLTSTLVPAPAPLAIIQYEPLHPHDAFGRTMISNLAARGIDVPGVQGVPTLEAHRQRLNEAGFLGGQEGWEVREIWDSWVGQGEKERLRGLEMFDEEEEWVLLAGHYGIIRAWRDGSRGDSGD